MKMHLQLWLVFLEPAPWRVSMSMLLLLPLSTSAGGRHGPDAVMSPAGAGRQTSVAGDALGGRLALGALRPGPGDRPGGL